LDALASAREAAGYGKKANGIRTVKRVERQRVNSRPLKAVFKGEERGGLSTIKVPDEGEWEQGE